MNISSPFSPYMLQTQNRIAHNIATQIYQILGERNGREQTQHRTVRAVNEQTVFHALLNDLRAVDVQLNTNYGPAAAHVRDDVGLFFQVEEAIPENLEILLCVFE